MLLFGIVCCSANNQAPCCWKSVILQLSKCNDLREGVSSAGAAALNHILPKSLSLAALPAAGALAFASVLTDVCRPFLLLLLCCLLDVASTACVQRSLADWAPTPVPPCCVFCVFTLCGWVGCGVRVGGSTGKHMLARRLCLHDSACVQVVVLCWPGYCHKSFVCCESGQQLFVCTVAAHFACI